MSPLDKPLALSVAFLLSWLCRPAHAAHDFWLVPDPEGGKPQVRVILGGDEGVRMVEIGENSVEKDEQGKSWDVTYRLATFSHDLRGGYALCQQLSGSQGHETKNYIKVFGLLGKQAYTLGPVQLTPLALSRGATRLALGHVIGNEISKSVDYLVFADDKGNVTEKQTGNFSPRVRFSPSGDWVAYTSGDQLVMQQFSTQKTYKKSLVEVAHLSGSPLVREFVGVSNDGVLRYRFKAMTDWWGASGESDAFTKRYDPKAF